MYRPRHRSRAVAVALVLVCLGCYADTQRFPEPMLAAVDPLPPGTTQMYPAGPEEVLVVRIADPVHVMRPGEASSFPLYFYAKQARMSSGSWVFAGSGGRLEVLYPQNSSITLYGRGSGVVGSESRGEPMFFFRQVDRARVTMHDGQQVRLLGGAVLAGDGGPFVIEHVREEILRVRNRSQGSGRVAYRDEVFNLDPGHVIDLPLIEAGGTPLETEPGLATLEVAGVPVLVRGELELEPDPLGTRVRATGENELLGFGLRLRLDPGDEILFSDLSVRSVGRQEALPEEPTPEPEGPPGPEETEGLEGPQGPGGPGGPEGAQGPEGAEGA